MLKNARSGDSQVLVLRGDPGSGKTALLGYVAEQLGGWTLLSAVGVQSERALAYNGLHQLCAPIVTDLPHVPAPQREALATVLGLSAGPAPDAFLVALAALSLFSAAAEDRPVACVVDDAQWLDDASAQVLEFVARRLRTQSIAVICAARTGGGDAVLAGLPVLPVGGLGEADARALLLDNVPGPIDPAVVDQIIAESRGNPRALLELPATWTPADLAGGFGLPDAQPVSNKVEQSYVRKIATLPRDTQLLLIAAAAEPLGDPDLLGRAVSLLDIEMSAATPAIGAGLLRMRDRVEFTHPLARSATYRTATRDDRHRVHRALADVTDPRLDPDRRAWHRARGTKAVNEDVAHELERSAGAAQSRGGFAAAGAFLTRAAELTPDSARRSRRALRAAFVDVQAGAFDAARRMLTIAGDGPGNSLQRARIDLAAAQLAFASSRRTEASARLLAAARRLERLDVDLARETYLDAMSAALFGARRDRRPGAAEIVRAARAAPRPTAQVTAADLLLDGLVALADDYRTAVPLCRIAVRALADGRNLPPAQLRRLWQGCVVALELWDDDCAHTLSAHHVDLARRAGALSELALAIGSATPLLVLRGDLAGAASIMTEGRSVEDATGISSAPHASAIVAAWRGHAREAQHLIADSIDRATSRGEAVAVAMGEYASAVVANSLGDYDAGVRAGRRATHDREIVVENWGLSELVESASRTGQLDLARNASDRLAEKASAAGTDWALGVARRSEALVSDTTRAEELYRESIERLRRTRIRAELARAHLLFGEWLRRTHRPADARSELQTALDLFRDMDMDGFAERARRELLATGAKVRKRSVETNHDLTAQEAQIARLAGNGLSNPEIAAQLFISSRTVEWHLRKVFMKLGITSRRQLRTPFGPGATTTG